MFAVLLTGDGGWSQGTQSMALAFRSRGIPVVGFLSPSYLQVPRTPDIAGEDLRRLLEHYLREWPVDRVIVVGYSRGADMLPFMVSRLPSDLRQHLAVVAMVGLSDEASFQYRPTDLFADGLRFTDRPVAPEVEKLRGLRMICISGKTEGSSLCPRLDSSLVRLATHAGGHRVTRPVGASVVELILANLRPGDTPVPRLPGPPPRPRPT
jgi:type IV secretory pathway VirJ component